VLDIATGTGEPGLTIATMLKGGKVIITDLSENMLEIARENAMKRGIKNMELPIPPPGSPGMFSCAKEGIISDLFLQEGLENITQKKIAGKMNFKTTDIYWSMMTEVVSLVVATLSKADDDMKEKIKKEVYQALHQKYPDKNILMDSSALVIYGEK
jgi:SAM-dependent methyltransferase